jgi:hypothetical protein
MLIFKEQDKFLQTPIKNQIISDFFLIYILLCYF